MRAAAVADRLANAQKQAGIPSVQVPFLLQIQRDESLRHQNFNFLDAF
jgi:hypothetical protein